MIFWSKTNEGKITFLGRASVCLWPHDSHWQADFPTRLLFFCKWKSTKTMNHTDKLIVQLNSFFANTKAQKSTWWPFENVMCWLESGNVLTLQIAGFHWIEAVGPFFLDSSSRPSPPSRLNKLCMGATLSFTEWIFCWICFDTGRFFTGMLISWCHDVVKKWHCNWRLGV